MARALDKRQQGQLSEFVNELAKIAGYETTAEWSRDSGYPAPNLSNLRNKAGAVDGYNLLRLIRAAAAKAEIEPVKMALVASGQPSRSGDDPSNTEIARLLEALSVMVAEGLVRLGAGGSVEEVRRLGEVARDRAGEFQEPGASPRRSRG